MSFETALRSRLKAAAGLSGRSIEWSRRAQGVFPAIVLTVVSDPIGRHMTGSDGLRRPRVQIDVLALDAATKVALRSALIAAIEPAATIGGVLFGRAQDMRVADMSEQTDTEFVFRDMIEAVLPHMMET